MNLLFWYYYSRNYIDCQDTIHEPRLIKKVQKAILADYVQRNEDE